MPHTDAVVGARAPGGLVGAARRWLVLVTLTGCGGGLALVTVGLLDADETWVWLALLLSAPVAAWAAGIIFREDWSLAALLGSSAALHRSALLAVTGVSFLLATLPSAPPWPVIVLVPVAALAEEMLLRWFPVRAQVLTGVSGPRATMVIAMATSLAFAAAHGPAHPQLILDRVVFGLLAYLVCVRARDVWASFAFHLASNTFAIILPRWADSSTAMIFVIAFDVSVGLLLAALVSHPEPGATIHRHNRPDGRDMTTGPAGRINGTPIPATSFTPRLQEENGGTD